MLLLSKISDARQRTTRQVIDRNKWLQEQRREEKKEILNSFNIGGQESCENPKFEIVIRWIADLLVQGWSPCMDVEIEEDIELVTCLNFLTCIMLRLFYCRLIE